MHKTNRSTEASRMKAQHASSIALALRSRRGLCCCQSSMSIVWQTKNDQNAQDATAPPNADIHARSTPPVRLLTSATIFAASASISASVMVLSRGWIVTAMAIDFLPGSMPLPS